MLQQGTVAAAQPTLDVVLGTPSTATAGSLGIPGTATAGSYTGSYLCHKCNQWIAANGTIHYCFNSFGQTSQALPNTITYYPYPNRDAEILQELKRIRELLEKPRSIALQFGGIG